MSKKKKPTGFIQAWQVSNGGRNLSHDSLNLSHDFLVTLLPGNPEIETQEEKGEQSEEIEHSILFCDKPRKDNLMEKIPLFNDLAISFDTEIPSLQNFRCSFAHDHKNNPL